MLGIAIGGGRICKALANFSYLENIFERSKLTACKEATFSVFYLETSRPLLK